MLDWNTISALEKIKHVVNFGCLVLFFLSFWQKKLSHLYKCIYEWQRCVSNVKEKQNICDAISRRQSELELIFVKWIHNFFNAETL